MAAGSTQWPTSKKLKPDGIAVRAGKGAGATYQIGVRPMKTTRRKTRDIYSSAIPVDRIRVPTTRLRKLQPEKVDMFVDSIRRGMQLPPIGVESVTGLIVVPCEIS